MTTCFLTGCKGANLLQPEKEFFVPRCHSNDLFRFSYNVFKFEYIVIKLVLLGLSLYGLYKLVESETGWSLRQSAGAASIRTQNI